METRAAGEFKVAVMLPRIDATSAKEVEDALAGLIDAGARAILCDFSATEYISSAGLRALLGTAKKLQRVNGKIVLFGLKPYVNEVFEVSGFTQIFRICKTEGDAVAVLNG